MLKKLKNNYFLIISTFLILYFFFNLLSGERGLISYFDKKQILSSLQEKELSLTREIGNLEFKNSLLSDNLDLDYIEILIRQRFLYGKKNETIYDMFADKRQKKFSENKRKLSLYSKNDLPQYILNNESKFKEWLD